MFLASSSKNFRILTGNATRNKGGREMTEKEFQDILTAKLKEYFKKDGIAVNKWKNLIYRVIVEVV